jgi:hypothetical protein
VGSVYVVRGKRVVVRGREEGGAGGRAARPRLLRWGLGMPSGARSCRPPSLKYPPWPDPDSESARAGLEFCILNVDAYRSVPRTRYGTCYVLILLPHGPETFFELLNRVIRCPFFPNGRRIPSGAWSLVRPLPQNSRYLNGQTLALPLR